ncbi:MAG: hypothetical protein IT229_08335 [Flavobacteriales bacterium]|nr:hypothetical protein [Flavobacteriales bacterium]
MPLLLGHALFLTLLVLGWQHAEARMIHVDSAWQFFKWINVDGVQVEAHRYSAVLPQLVIKLFLSCGASLNTLVVVASEAHVLVGYAVFLSCAYLWRAPKAMLGCALATVLCTRLAFYGPVLEANYLTCYPFLLLGWLEAQGEGRGPRFVLVAVALLLVSLVVHPVGWVIMAAILVLQYVQAPTQRPVLRWLIGVCVAWALLGRLLLPPSPYEAGLYSAVLANVKDVANGSHWNSIEFLFGHTWSYTTHFLPAWVLMALVTVALVRERKGLQISVALLGWIGFILLNLFTYAQGETAVMMEKNFVPLATLVAVPAVGVMMSVRSPWRSALLGLFALVIFVKLRDISFAARPMEERLATIEALVQDARSQDAQKAVDGHDALVQRGLGVHWALAFETLLCSSLETPTVGVTVICDRENSGWDHTDGLDLGVFGSALEPGSLNTHYFNLPIGAYERLRPTDELP